MTVFFLRLISRLPYRILHGLSSCMALLAQFVFQYRRKVIQGNLERSFPEATVEWRSRTERLFYRHFADITLESVKHFTISSGAATSRMVHEGVSLFQGHFDQGRSVLIAGGHLNNWELYAMSANQLLQHDVMAVYKKLSDEKMDEAVRNSRQRFGLEMVRTVDAQNWMDAYIDGDRPKAVVMGFDQSPADPVKSWWTPFLNQETAWYFGLEKWARAYDLPVIYGHIYKIKRGHYRTVYEVVTDHPKSLPEGAILQKCIALLEADIRRYPDEWLWSHKRWKHRRPAHMPLHERTSLTESFRHA